MNHPDSDKGRRHRHTTSVTTLRLENYVVRLLPLFVTYRHGAGNEAPSATSLHGEAPLSVVDSFQSHG